jgi:PAS domain S-box-containing protein
MDGFWLVDSTGRLLEVNEAYCRMSGYSEKELLSMRISDFDAIETVDDVNARIRSIIDLGEMRFESKHRRKDGTLFDVEVSVRSLTIGQGQCVAFLRDITDRKIAEQKANESRELFSQFLKHSPIHAYIKAVTPTESRVIQASENYEDMIGIPGSQMIGKTMHDLFPPEFAEKISEDDWAVVASGQVLKLDEDLNGRHYTTIKFPLTIGHNHLLAGYTIDITERKLAENALREKEKLLRESQQLAHLGSYSWDIETGRWESSEIMDDIFGIDESYDRTLGGWSALIHPEWRYAMTEYVINEVMGKRREFDREYKIVHQKTGKERWLHGLGHLEVDDQNRPTRLFGTITDITERKYAERELILAKEHAERLDKLKDAFIANISHEIRTPLNAIAGFSDLIQEACTIYLDESQQAYFDHIQFGVQRLLRTVDLILVLSRIQSGDIQLKHRMIDLPAQLNLLRESLAIQARQKGIDLVLHNEIGNLEIYADEYCLTEAISNLVNNAIKFTERGSVTMQLWRTSKQRIALDIIDTGIGISDAYKPLLFEPYTQEEIGYSRRYEGIGLGMALVKKYLDLLAVPISFESEKGEGTTFHLDLTSVVANISEDTGSV